MVVHTTTAEETEAFGARLAGAWPGWDDTRARLARNDTRAQSARNEIFGVVYLTGDLGAGKTTLTRGFVRALGVTGSVRSPTYTLVEVYETGALTALHLDLYRLSDPAELENLGLREWAREGHLWLIEWPERGADRLPHPDLVVTLVAGEGRHDIEVSARSALGVSWLERAMAHDS
jgi:tRNA threonylcarbamoyladenosine biosynthesis protein TsaE